MISTRYSFPVILLLLLALVPTVIHSYMGLTYDDAKSVQNIATTFNDFTSLPAKRNEQWGKDIFDSDDWFERDYRNTAYTKVRLFVARSYNHKKLYHHPELALSYAQNLSQHRISTLPNHPEIPIHILTNDDKSIFVAYTLLYGDNFIENPIYHQLAESVRLLVSPRKLMTLFYASQTGLAADASVNQSATLSLLSQAIQSFKQQQALK